MVIQLPNPLLLPQSYGMGEVAGMSFGSNYTVMMQIGYAHYAPRILKDMEKNPEKAFYESPNFIKFQKELLVFSDRSINNTMNRVLDMPDKVIKAVFDKLFDLLPTRETIDETTETSALNLGSEIQQVRLDLGQATRRDTERENRDRSDDARSLAERDAQNRRDAAERNQIDRETDFTGRTRSQQQKVQDATNVTPKFWKGATSKRRKTQSSQLFETKLKKLVQSWFTYINLNKNNSVKLKLGLAGLRKQSQNLADWQFTYI